MDILDDMGVNKLSANFFKVNYSFKSKPVKNQYEKFLINLFLQTFLIHKYMHS